MKLDGSIKIDDRIKIDDIAPVADRSTDLEAEIEELQAEVRRLSHRLDEERAHRGVLQRAVGYATARARALERTGAVVTLGPEEPVGTDPEIRIEPDPAVDPIPIGTEVPVGTEVEVDENLYVFDDEDESREAFDRFFGAPDPHLDKVRGFLLD